MEDGVRWTDRITSSSGEWSGNIYDFYFRVYNKMTDHVQATSSELSILLGVGQERTRKILRELAAEEIIVTEGANRNRIYRLKA